MKTTLNKIRQHDPCKEGWEKLLRSLGKTRPDDEPLSILTILESNGLDDALWCLRAVEGYEKEIRLYAVACARQVQHLMIDPRSLAVLDVAERYAHGLATDAELAAAWAAAWAAARGAARAAAWGAAEGAARGAAWAAAEGAAWAAACGAAWAAARGAAWAAARAEQADLLRTMIAEQGESKMKYMYIINSKLKLIHTNTTNQTSVDWRYKDTPEAAWECALAEVRRNVKEQEEEVKEAQQTLKKVRALLARVEARIKEQKCTTK